jgi:hypothetical protein
MSLVSDVQILLDESGGAVFWLDSQLYDALNEALVELYASTKPLKTSTEIFIPAGAGLVPLPTTYLIPLYIEDADKRYDFTTLANLERLTRGWRGTPADIPQEFVMWDQFTVRPYPRADNDYIYTLWGVPYPTEISLFNQDVTLPFKLKKAIVYKAASILLESTNSQLADALAQTSSVDEQAYLRQQRNNQSHNIRRLKPPTSPRRR